MKKLLTVLLLTASATAFAQHHHHWRHHGHHSGPGFGYWVAPLVIGGVVGAAIAKEHQQPQSVIIQQPPQTVVIQRQTVCTESKEIQNSDGQIYRERTCTQ